MGRLQEDIFHVFGGAWLVAVKLCRGQPWLKGEHISVLLAKDIPAVKLAGHTLEGNNMRQLGGLLAFLGGFAIVLDFMDRVPSFLFWIYNWGAGPAWGIKIALLVIGGLMYFFGSDEEGDQSAE